jgi:tetratricopeptide (TPR) repeat protein/predicted Ser/Thr protein kinase
VIGSQISHYRVLSKIGEGGMGEVYLAQDLRLDRRVALKFLPEGQAVDETARRRLLREANAAARLDHPFITKVYEVGEDGPQPFIAMELVEGVTLKERLVRGPIPLPEAVRIASEIAEALEFASRRGIVHRDLKPANVMITSDRHAKVMDFGIAKHASVPSADGTPAGPSLTSTGEIVGTPAYMAPEQLKGLPLDSRADIFALGVCFYEMVTGAHPFLKDSAFATGDAILNQPAPPLDRYLTNPPAHLEHVFRRALAKEPDQRYQSFNDLRIDLGQLELPQARTAIAPPAPPRSRRRWLAAAIVGLVAAGGGLVWWLWPAQLSLSQRALAFNERDWILIADFDNQTQDPVFDRSLRAALEVAIAQSQYVNVFPAGRLPETLRLMNKSQADKLDEALAADVAIRERVKAVLVCSIADVGGVYALTAKVMDPHSRAAVSTESVQANGKANVLPALDELATRVRKNLGESLAGLSAQNVALPRATTGSLEALRLYAESLRADQRKLHRDLLQQALQLDPEFALAHAALGHSYYLNQDRASRQQGEEHFVKALGLLDRLSRREQLWITALAEDSRGNRAAAAAAYETYLAEYPDDQAAWFRVGWTYLAALQQYEKAIEAFKRSIELNPSSASSFVNLATAYSGLDKYKDAVEQYHRAFDLRPQYRTDTIINHEYGFVLVRVRDLKGAAQNFERMLADNSTVNQARGHRSLGLLEMYRGRYGAAIDRLRQAVLINKTNKATVSEYRDRLYLARAYKGKGMEKAFGAELDSAHRLALGATLAPEWLRLVGKRQARAGRISQARTILALMEKTAGDATASSSVARNLATERAQIDVVRGEIELAEGRSAKALDLLEAAFVVHTRVDTLESLASALVAAGRLEDAARRYEEIIARGEIGTEDQEHWFAAHSALADVYRRLGRLDRARELYTALLSAWAEADEDLVALKAARQALGSLK